VKHACSHGQARKKGKAEANDKQRRQTFFPFLHSTLNRTRESERREKPSQHRQTKVEQKNTAAAHSAAAGRE
jgi:hypothetical protein